MDSKKLFIFDLDGTLTPSKSNLEPETAELLMALLKTKKVGVMSGGGYPRLQSQFINWLPHGFESKNLYLLPTSGSRLYTWKGGWHQEYAEDLTPKEIERITEALKYSLKLAGHIIPDKTFGETIENRDSQITFSALGQNAPSDLKAKWDPDHQKRQKIAEILKKKLPQYDINIGGTTSIDITKKGVNKAYGIRKMENFLRLHPDEITFVGDALFLGGNDYPARATGVDCVQVSGPEETRAFLRKLTSSSK